MNCSTTRAKRMTKSDQPAREPELVHQFKNHLSIIVGYCDLLMAELSDDDAKRKDIAEVHKAAPAAMALMPELENRLR